MAKLIRVVHRTEYRYRERVDLNPHRLMLRPRDGHDMWVEDAYLRISPPARLRWFFDVFGNSVAEARFEEPTNILAIESELLLRRYVIDRSTAPPATHVGPYPIRYDEDERFDLSPYLRLHGADQERILRAWLATAIPERPANAFAFLTALSDAIHDTMDYSRREEMGTRTAGETIRAGGGTCRDFAFLFMEAARLNGFAARFVTGYLGETDADARGGGATHAWAEAFIPEDGWIEFDPTNRLVGASSLIRVGTTRTPAQATPISGSYSGPAGAFEGLSVSVHVAEGADGDAAGPASRP